MARKKQFDYFAAMAALANNASTAARSLQTLLNDDYNYEKFIAGATEIHELENESDDLVMEINEQLAISFMTPIDREDISLLTDLLDDVIDDINSFSYLMENLVVRDLKAGVSEFAQMIVDVTDGMVIAVKEFSKFKNSKVLKEDIRNVRVIESGADKLFSELTKAMFSDENANAVDLVRWREVYTALEDIVNDTETAVKTIGSLVIKNT
jgi:uncharacterized protein Yka (UPF0111/DUF47 family)